MEADGNGKGWAVEVGDELGLVKVSVEVVEAGTTVLMSAGDGGQEEIEVAGVDVVDCCHKESLRGYELLGVFGVWKEKGVEGVMKLDGG